MATLTICNHKGGTGKTTSSVHLAAAFGLMGHRVLLVDLDPQGFLTRTVGANEPRTEHSSLALIHPEGDLRKLPVQSFPHFDVLGASMNMTREQRRLTRPTDVFWMRETLAEGHDYDLILIDTAAAVSVFTMNALVASDAVLIPVTPEYQPVVGAEQTWQTCGLVRNKLNPGLQAPRFLLTQVDGRLSRHARYSEYLKEKYAASILETPIRTSSSLAVAARNGRTVFDAKVMSRGGLDYAYAAAEVARVFFPELIAPAPIKGAYNPDEDLGDEPDLPPTEPTPPPPPAFGLGAPRPGSAQAASGATTTTTAPPTSAPMAEEPTSKLFQHAPIPGRGLAPAVRPVQSTFEDPFANPEAVIQQAADAKASIRRTNPSHPRSFQPLRPLGKDGATGPQDLDPFWE
ncbi:ParA family protein [Rubricoccus marinus]|uniref:AAA domain-containing protein n=1 Tax=Rubricoccus marinus TaxID=716817 RepID=A0A259TZN6_9BACT|nr:ParA family protein [Rubricoccus marinus]OZC03191.1 hypothetical protein BSZ36_09520 [Rubricoccus marinus]